MTDGGAREAIRAGRAPRILSDEDWSEVENLGVLDVLFVPTPGSDLISAVVVLSNARDQVHCWPLAERPSFDEALGAARFLLQGLAELRRRTRQRHPWAEPGDREIGDTDTPRLQAVSEAVDAWCLRFQRTEASAAMLIREEFEVERRRRAAAGAPVREARKRWNVTQAELASRAAIQVTILSEIERGLRVPTPDQRARIAEVLDADPEKLFTAAPTDARS